MSPSPSVHRLEENVGADAIRLSDAQLGRLTAIGPPAGDLYADMTSIGC